MFRGLQPSYSECETSARRTRTYQALNPFWRQKAWARSQSSKDDVVHGSRAAPRNSRVGKSTDIEDQHKRPGKVSCHPVRVDPVVSSLPYDRGREHNTVPYNNHGSHLDSSVSQTHNLLLPYLVGPYYSATLHKLCTCPETRA